MASTISSDLVADVMRNADPSRLSSAVRRLDRMRSDTDFGTFQAVLARSEDTEVHEKGPGLRSDLQSNASSGLPRPLHVRNDAEFDTHVAFERMVLRNLFQLLLPSTDSGVFGTGPSADVWRSLAADQLGGLYASNGGIGIAATLSGDDGSANGDTRSEWPYFATDRIVAFSDGQRGIVHEE